MPRGALFSRGLLTLFFLGRPLVYISPHHHYHHKPANRWNIINYNFFFFSTIGSVLHSSAKWGTTQVFIWLKSTTSPPPLNEEIRRFVITHFLIIIFFTMALNERLRYDELCQSFIGVLLDHDRSASRARIGARSIMRKKVHCRVFLYTGHMFFSFKGNKNWTALFF